jgi:guanine deaminase
MKWLETEKEEGCLTTPEVFYLGTKSGGSFFGKVGSFEKGYDFDALVIDDSTLGEKDFRDLEERLQRYIYCGDDRNIAKRFVKGKFISEPTL